MRYFPTSRRFFQIFAAIALALFTTQIATPAQDKNWRPITADEIKSAPVVEPNADAEVLFWEVRVDDGGDQGLSMKHYIRVKIYTERGREKYSKVDIPFAPNVKIKEIMARVIKEDGSITEVPKTDVFEREIAKTDKIKVKAKSFAIPNVAPGVVVEYQYREFYNYTSANNMRLLFQHDVPIRSITYYFKPGANAKGLPFNTSDNKFIKDKNGFYRMSMENVPALKSEEFMPPEDEVRSWLLLHYVDDLKETSMDFWSRAGGVIVAVYDVKETLKPGKEIKAAAESIAAGASTPDEKMAKIFEFCKTKIKNITFDTSLTDEQKDEIKPNKSPAATYKNLRGTKTDVNELFASLATALGFESRLAFGGDRSQLFFNPQKAHISFVHFASVGVKINGTWQYYAPGDIFVPYGMVAWKAEDTSVLLLGYKDYLITKTPSSSPSESMAKRTGKFKLLEDGTLEGTVRIEYTGHLAYEYKTDNYQASANKREEDLKDEIKKTMSTAEVTAISIENVDDPEKPFVYQYKIRVPSYAQKTGKRLFLQPGFFEYGAAPAFSAAERKYAIFFHHPWSETDEVEIEVPKGYELDNPDIPGRVADPSNIGSLDVAVAFETATGIMKYQRKFSFGGNGKVLFPVGAYKPLKGLFDAFNKADTHTITLRQK